MHPTIGDMKTVLDRAATCVLVHSASTKRIIWANNAACDTLGFTLDELRSLKAHHMSAQDEQYRREVGIAWMQSAIVYGRSRQQWKYLTADGEELRTEATATHIQFREGPVIMVEFTVIDESGRQKSPQWISESLERIMTHTSSGILVLSKENRVEDASPVAAALFGLQTGQILGAYLGSLATLDPELTSEDVRQQMEQGSGRAHIRFKVMHNDGSTTWLAGMLEDLDFEGQFLRVLTVRDVSERIEWERRANYQQSNLQYLSRYNAMGDMAMILAHDLGQPLAASTNFLAGLKARINSGKADPESIAYAIEKIQMQLGRASDIVSSVKRYVRRIESTTVTMNLVDTLEESLYFVRLRAEEDDIEVQADLSARELAMEGESVLIGQVIVNLCVNAIQEIAKPTTSVKVLKISANRESDMGCIYISDQGGGMQNVPVNRLAEGAFSSKQDGSGIGLIISEHIVERHGGTLTYFPNTPQGTTVKLAFPLKQKKPVGQQS